ncbi:UDP-D-xylose:L-fucose alpha-1,3-D-xylosyltransferase-like isoform X2 [Asterias rubens]|uniref:UDP-D-xylose:L-fucose alpha-1,3-D-xylosyltransferase-like isoform X2 n=1 Tax=Asterias rubens TaxID=7604 RepID=UPI0014550646|nr:UDP-D-xylose:L-fucose alpha-1,3-D-xylosyltransferase-like isoform X2 [Asterias rubens]XP_033645999.1 UDP-D-xylose:L-fucose alpha-1,3-D-xylosyltransferase-like isoform X2 [Asterias rubens]XP_033646000.1 UDP-D-xylose:L-fucose alpha-1,3-D-xylosyltransferase-like isoform X2 [Asterias rubens]
MSSRATLYIFFLFVAVALTSLLCYYFKISPNIVLVNEWDITDRQILNKTRGSTIVRTTAFVKHRHPLIYPVSYIAPVFDCTKPGINKNCDTAVLTTTNAGFLDITENMLESVRRVGAQPNITIITEDDKSYEVLSERAKTQPGLRIQKTDSGKTGSEAMRLNSKVYNHLVNKRPAYVLSFLENGNRVLFMDVDTFWFRDPLRDMDWDFDIALHNEFTAPREWFCDGIVYYSPTNNTINLVKEWAHLLATTEKNTPDQHVLNRLIAKKKIPGLKVKTLKNGQFPDGLQYFNNSWRKKNNDTIVLHLSYIIGHDVKVNKLKKYGLWVI